MTKLLAGLYITAAVCAFGSSVPWIGLIWLAGAFVLLDQAL